MVDQDLTHRARRQVKEVVLAQDPGFEAMQLQEELADQGGGLQRVSGALPAQQGAGDGLETVESKLVDGVPRGVIAELRFFEQSCERFGHFLLSRKWQYSRVPRR